ncbi:alpha/beta hydrolase [Salipaludibacillus neizhouensis]|uniref:Alpha/beta hydrolase n=1 Tax=Salipaludibacillus neizhouensis TaxID=885475 RepID=A0A3A9K537_9BACI|nr:alpha/beta hydrolase [Salipaludibacillus neizhouensis]RKL67429.1 alpha/beta hydrolase [Salipaludibacillus neizhouensis]
MIIDVDFHFIETNGIRLHVAFAGPEDGPLVLLLHGFPEFWYGWKNQIEPLANAGYRVVIPDQRGYNLSDKPEGIANYTLDKLRDDIIGLIKACGRESATIIGHDWGGAVAWYLTATRPQYVDKLVAVNIPHLSAMKKTILSYPPQWLKSSYILLFQLPDIPESFLKSDNYKRLTGALLASSKKGTFHSVDIDYYHSAWSQEGSVTGMLTWYRAMRFAKLPSEKIAVSTRIIWGMDDQFLSVESAKKSLNFCENGELIFVGEATHWVNHEQPEIVTKLILEFI